MKKQLQMLVNEVLEELRGIGIEVPQKITYEINPRLRRALGRARRIGENTFIVELSKDTMQVGGTYAKQVLHHEILHTMPGCMNHGKKWQAWAHRINRELGYDISRCTSGKEVIEPLGKEKYMERYKYRLKCTRGGNEIYRMKASNVVQNPDRYRCKCGGHLVSETL